MNRFQFMALFFSINLLHDGLNQYIKIGLMLCALMSFVIGLQYNDRR
jgi:hypothetical protein